MKKKTLAILFVLTCLISFSTLRAADIKGKVRLSKDGEPYSHGSILLEPLGVEKRIKAEIDKEGNFAYQNIEPGKYSLWVDLYSATPSGGEQREIEIKEEDDTLELTCCISASILDIVLFFT